MNAPCRPPFRGSAPALSAALAGVFLFGASAAQEKSPAPTKLPPYLKGIDLNQPAQDAFKSWPPKELEERSYWLPWTAMSLQRAVVCNQPVFLLVTVPLSRPAQ